MVLIIFVGIGACTVSDSDDGAATNGVAPDAGDEVPTLADVEMITTDTFLTANAPPPGFGQVNFDPIDAHLSDRPGWSYVTTGRFTGTFDDTGEPAEGRFEVQVQSNELSVARRVVLDVEGGALSPDESPRHLEGVRLSNDYYMVDTNGQCSSGGEGASAIADLSAGQLIGGVVDAVPTGHRQEIAGIPAWQYTFTPGNVRLPAVHRETSSSVALEADLWISPDYNAVLRFELTLTVERVRILWAERSVSGTLYLRYELDVSALDVQPNISIPYGCPTS
jgi:hypothetical protein